jgi:hypothetical protein
MNTPATGEYLNYIDGFLQFIEVQHVLLCLSVVLQDLIPISSMNPLSSLHHRFNSLRIKSVVQKQMTSAGNNEITKAI